MSEADYIKNRQEQERTNAIESARSSWLTPFAAGIGTIALGSFILKKRIAEGGNLSSSIFNFLGLPRGVSLNAIDDAANVAGSAARSGTSGIRSILDATYDIDKKSIRLGPIDIIDDLRNSAEFIGTSHASIGDSIAALTTEFTHRELVNAGNNTGFFTKDLQRVTFGQIFADQANWQRVLGASQFGVLEKSRQLGLISDSLILDRKIFYNKNTNEILDFRIRNAFSNLKTSVINGEEITQRVSRFDLFGQGSVVSSITGINRNIAVIGPGDGFNGGRVFLGGNIYGFERNAATGNYDTLHLATDRFLRKAGDPLEVINASRTGRVELNVPERKSFLGSLLSRFENATGIGPSFSSRPNILQRWIIDPYKRARAIESGEGVIIKNPFHREFRLNKVMDATLGGEIPELSRAGGHVVPNPGGGVATNIKNVDGSIYGVIPNRVGVFFDLADDYSVVKKSSYRQLAIGSRQALVGSDLVVPTRKGGYRITGKTIPERSRANAFTDIDRAELTAVGFKSVSNNYGYYDVVKTATPLGRSKIASNLKDFAAYSLYRLNNLASESLLGIGFAPSHSVLTNTARLASLPIIYQAGLKTAEYGDYLSEKYTGISPVKAGASIYAGLRIAQQKAREYTGIRAASDFLDTYFPGSVNSDGSTIIRSIVAPIAVANTFLKGGNFIGALLGAAGTYAAIGGPEPNQTSSDLIREYSGDKKVPVRKGQFWGLGYLPFSGGKVSRYDYSWYAKLTSDYRTKSLYGSASEYWSYHANVFGIPFPTPSNLFGLNNLLNPYRLESMHYNDRPYAQTESDLINFPVIGPILARTVGEIIKPTIYRQPTELPLLAAGLAPRGLTANAARQMGIPGMNATAYEAEDPTTLLSTIKRQANIATEPLGVYKFAMNFFGIKFDTDLGTEYATSATMGDPGRFLYDSGIGGALGQTELLRRYMLSDYSSQYRRAAQINPIKNSMPDWLPGAYARNVRDQNYFIDFTIGDAYSKLIDGESRLPGAGYEALNDLHSGIQGQYDDVDRFMILADVAPYSTAYKQYERKVLSMNLDPEWQNKVQETIKQRQEVIGVDTRYKRYEEDIVAMNMSTITKSLYAPIRKAYDFLTHDVLAEIPYVGSKFFPFRSPQEQYRKMYVEGSEYASWDRPWEDIVRPAIYDTALEDPITAAGKGAMLGYLMSGPMRWFTPLKAIVGDSGGHGFNPMAVAWGAAAGAGLSAARIGSLNTQDMIPYHLRRENEAVQYMDTLNYIRDRVFQQQGTAIESPAKTMLGATNPIQYRSALPRSADRTYFDYFNTMPEGNRQSVIEGLPGFMRYGLEASWSSSFLDRDQADAVATDFINTNQIPDSSWLGWNPNISNEAVILRLIDNGINGVSDNIHRFGFYESHEVDLKTRLAAYNQQTITFTQSPIVSSLDQFLVTQSRAISRETASIKSIGTALGSRKEMNVSVNRDKEHQQQIKHRFR